MITCLVLYAICGLASFVLMARGYYRDFGHVGQAIGIGLLFSLAGPITLIVAVPAYEEDLPSVSSGLIGRFLRRTLFRGIK